MNSYLAFHPELFMGPKEMHCFGSDLHFGRRFYRRDLRAYLSEFSDGQDRPHGGEASVWYLLSKRAALEIKAYNPQARIIIMLREPGAMLYSLYHQFRYDGNEHLPTFAEALAAEHERHAGRRLSRQTYFPQGLVYREVARYADQVNRYFEVFGRDQVHVVIYDDFAADPAAAYRSVLAALGLETPAVTPLFKVINGGDKGVSHAWLRAVLNDPLLRPSAVALARRLPRSVFNALRAAEGRVQKFNSRTEKHAPLPPAIHAALKREFAPEIERLSELLGRDLTHWSR